MRSFVFRLLVLSWSLGFGAFAHALQVQEKTVQELEQLLRQNQIQISSSSETEKEALFRARSTAHRLRLAQIYLNLSKDPEFLKQFPQYKSLVQDSTATVNGILEHDVAKGLEKTKSAIQVLSKLQGYDQYTVPPGTSKEAHGRIKTILKAAVSDINSVDDEAMEKKYKALGKSEAWIRNHRNLTEVLDYYDTYKSRQSELAQNTRKLESPSQWLEHLEDKTPEKIKLAKFLENKDPLKDKHLFAKAEDFLESKKATSEGIEEKFQGKSREILWSAKGKSIGRLTVGATRRLKGGALGSAASLGLAALLTPEDVSGEEAIQGLAIALETASCDTHGCQAFMQSCARKMGLTEPFRLEQIAKSPKKEICLKEFFDLPLEQQTELRRDGNLNRFFLQHAPRVVDIKCDKNPSSVEVETDQNKERYTQLFYFSPKGELQRLTRKTESSLDSFNFGESALLQHCPPQGGNCKNLPLNGTSSLPLQWAFRQIPLDSYRWLQRHQKMAEAQSDQILSCCQRQSCQSYFQKLSDDRAPKSKEIQSAR
ncbi:MAG: hypothetical protein ACAH59_08015 [Pseudobdellovibrionaceae bacterium]